MKRRTPLLLVFVIGLLLVPSTATANHGGLRIVTHSSYTDSIDNVHIVGVVANDSSHRYRFVEIDVALRNASGTVVDTDFTFSDMDELTPHSTSPFHIIVSDPPAYSTYRLTVSGSTMSASTQAPLSIEMGSPFYDSIDVLHIPGEVFNRSGHSLDFVSVIATIYNGSQVLTTDFTFTDPGGDIGPNGSATFEVFVSGPTSGYTRIVLQAQGDVGASGYAASWDNYFGDLGATKFRHNIIWLAESGITSGCRTGAFCPDGLVTRGQMATFLARALQLPSTGTDYFRDDEGSTHENNINRLRAAGITTGCGGTRFCPDGLVTRGQMASFLVRGYNLPSTGADYFTDDEGNTHEANINRLRASSITFGCGGTNYCPNGLVTRGQMAAFIQRAES